MARQPGAGMVISTEEQPVSFGWLEQSLAFRLRRANEASFNALVGSTQGDLNFGFMAVLTLVAENPGINQQMLSRAIKRDKSTLTTKIKTLEDLNLLTRTRDPVDKRNYIVNLTPKGVGEFDRLRARARAHDRALLNLVGADQSQIVLDALERMTRIVLD